MSVLCSSLVSAEKSKNRSVQVEVSILVKYFRLWISSQSFFHIFAFVTGQKKGCQWRYQSRYDPRSTGVGSLGKQNR